MRMFLAVLFLASASNIGAATLSALETFDGNDVLFTYGVNQGGGFTPISAITLTGGAGVEYSDLFITLDLDNEFLRVSVHVPITQELLIFLKPTAPLTALLISGYFQTDSPFGGPSCAVATVAAIARCSAVYGLSYYPGPIAEDSQFENRLLTAGEYPPGTLVPEPGTAWLLAVSLVLFALHRKTRPA